VKSNQIAGNTAPSKYVFFCILNMLINYN